MYECFDCMDACVPVHLEPDNDDDDDDRRGYQMLWDLSYRQF